jgi:hypothetical protein
MLARVDPTLAVPQALCVCPTRELVVQNLMVLQRMAKYTKITATSTASDDIQTSRYAFFEPTDSLCCLSLNVALDSSKYNVGMLLLSFL